MAQEIADSTLLDTWASSGVKIGPDISKIIEGWQLGEQPPHEYMNWLQNTFGSKLNHILKNGIAKWEDEKEYLAGATVQYNSNVWLCKATNANSEPTELNNNWDKIPSLENLPLTVNTINDFPTGATTGDTCIVKDLDRGGIFVYDSTKVSEDNQGTNFNGWIRQYSGAINVKWFGARGDGVTSNQSGIVAAVAAAYAIGTELEWPAGTYVSDADIPHFHDVSHVGKGTVKRGAYTFAPAPANKMKMRNRIYVSAAGSGDGLSPDFPTTLDTALAAISFRGPALTGLWGIQLAAGTYTAPTETLSNITSDNYILIAGPDVSGGVPTAIIDANGGEQALRIIGRCNVQLQDIKGVNATASSVASAFIIDNGGTVYAQNVHTYNTSWAGINFNVAQRAVVYGGRFENSSGYGVRCYGGTVLSLGKDGDRPQFVNCVMAGAIAQGSSYGHIDYCDFADCGIGVNTVFDSHVACLECTFTNCATPAQAEHNSSISFDPTSMSGYTRQMRSRSGVQVYDGANGRFDEQTYPYSGTNGKTAYGYNDWVVPTCKYQYSNNGTTSGFNLSSLTPATALWESNGNTILALAAPTANYSAWWFADATHERRAEIRQSSGNLNILFSGNSAFRFRNTDIAASTDNTLSNGTAILRWSVVYAGTGTINTSDAREKTFSSIPEVEKQVAIELKGLMRRFKFNDAIEAKGEDKARIHYGTSAQEVIAVFEKYGLNAMEYAMVCYDEWEEQQEVQDEDGTIIEPYRPSGNRYGIRYEELLCFIISAM